MPLYQVKYVRPVSGLCQHPHEHRVYVVDHPNYQDVEQAFPFYGDDGGWLISRVPAVTLDEAVEDKRRREGQQG